MKIESTAYYEHPYKTYPYTHQAETIVKSLGTLYGKCRIPDLYVTAAYYFDQKTGLPAKEVKLTFRPNGPCAAQLNFPHAEVEGNWKGGLYVFSVKLHAIFNADTIVRETYRGEGKVSAGIKVFDVEGGGGYEKSTEKRDTPFIIHAEYNGQLYTKQNVLKIGGAIK